MAQDMLSNKVINRRTMGETTTTAAVSRDISIRDPMATNPVNIADGSLATEGLNIGVEAINAEDTKVKAKAGTTIIPGTRVDMVAIKIDSFGQLLNGRPCILSVYFFFFFLFPDICVSMF